MRNRYPGDCVKCGGWTTEGAGDCVKDGSRWLVTCDDCTNEVSVEDRVVVERWTIHGYHYAGETFTAGSAEDEDISYRTVIDAKTRRANGHDVEMNQDCGDMSLQHGDDITTFTSRPATDEEIATYLAHQTEEEAEREAARAQHDAYNALKNAPLGEEVARFDRSREVKVGQYVPGYGDDFYALEDGTVVRHHRNYDFDPDNWTRRVDLPNALELVSTARYYTDNNQVSDDEILTLIERRDGKKAA